MCELANLAHITDSHYWANVSPGGKWHHLDTTFSVKEAHAMYVTWLCDLAVYKHHGFWHWQFSQLTDTQQPTQTDASNDTAQVPVTQCNRIQCNKKRLASRTVVDYLVKSEAQVVSVNTVSVWVISLTRVEQSLSVTRTSTNSCDSVAIKGLMKIVKYSFQFIKNMR